MSILKRRRIETSVERNILIGGIVSTDYLIKVKDIINVEHFEIRQSKRIWDWIIDYYEQYEKAPNEMIQKIFITEKERLSLNEAELIENFLESLSDEFNADTFNSEYLLDKTLRFVRKRNLEILKERIESNLLKNRIKEAEDLVRNFKRKEKETSESFNPFDENEVEEHFLTSDENQILILPGALGQLFRAFERGWLVSFTAPEKRGKSFILEEMAVQGLLQGLKVLFISLEMGKKELKNRLYKRISGLVDEKGNYVYPVFDCLLNQTNECSITERSCDLKLRSEDNEKPEFGFEPRNYLPCVVCRENDNKREKFVASYWFDEIEVNKLDKDIVSKKARMMQRQYGANLRVRAFPAYTANSDDVLRELEILESTEGFVTDLLVIDYLDILASEKGGNDRSERGNIDITWKTFKKVTQIKHLLGITADQSSKITYDRDVRLYDTSEDKRKNAHVDVKIAINQTEQEKRDNVIRLCEIAHRHKFFHPSRQVIVLQQLAMGQPYLDSEWFPNSYIDNKKSVDNSKKKNKKRRKGKLI